MVRVAAAPAGVKNGGGEEEGDGAGGEGKGSGSEHALHGRAGQYENETNEAEGSKGHFLLILLVVRLVLSGLDVNAIG